MRDGNRLKEKIELRLDQRQVVSFAMIALLLSAAIFALGVMVGKNLAGMPGPPPKPDNLLDRLDAKAAAAASPSDGGRAGAEGRSPGDDGLTFQEELTKPRPPLPPVPRPPKPAVVPRPKAEEAAAKPPKDAGATAVAAASPGEVARKPPPAPPDDAPAAPFFTVQVKATQSQPEAKRFAERLTGQGFSPFVADVDIPGKGHWYRVRVGRFGTRAQAERYLSDFKRETHLEAFVTAAGH